MAGISSKSALGLENKYKYNGIELDTSLGLDEYEAQLRDLDPQTGRWSQLDPETEGQETWSPYTSNNDNPILYKDPRGNEGEACCGGLLGKIYDYAVKGATWLNENVNPLTPIAEVITGKSIGSNLTEDKPRLQSAAEGAMFLAPEVKVEGTILKTIEKTSVKELENGTAKTIEKESVHANSKLSTKTNTLYRLETKEGEYLKTGITSKANPEKRYTNAFMKDKKMIPLDQGTRTEMLKNERKIVETNPGPLNKEPWAGKLKN